MPVGDLQRLVQHGQPLTHLGGRRGAGRGDVGAVEVHERPQPALLARGGDGGHRGGLGAGRVERHQRLTGGPVADELHGPQGTEAAHLAHRRVPFGQLAQAGPDHLLTQHPGVLDDALVPEDPDRRDRGGAGQGVPGVGEPTGVGPVGEGGSDPVGDQHPAERHVARVHPLGEGDQVGRDAPPVDGEPLAAAAEAGHHLVGDQQHAELVADRPHPGQVAVRGDQDAVGADHRLRDDRGDRVRALDHQRVPQVLQGPGALLGLGLRVEGRPVEVGTPVVDDTGRTRFGGPPPRVAGQGDRPGGGPVVGAVRGEHLVPTGVQPGHPDGVLVRLGAAVGEEHAVEVARRQLRDQSRRLAAGVVGEAGCDRGQPPRLLLDRRHQSGVLEADVEVDQLGGEVEVPVPVVVPEVRAQATGEGQGIDLVLRRPGVEDVGPIGAADVVPGPAVQAQEGGRDGWAGERHGWLRRGGGSAVAGEAEVDPGGGRVRPPRGDDLALRVEVDALGAVHVGVAEQGGLPPAEGVVGDRDRDRHVDPDHPHPHLGLERAGRAAVAGEDRGAVRVRVLVDQPQALLEGVHAHHAEHRPEDLVPVDAHLRPDPVEQGRPQEEALGRQVGGAAVHDHGGAGLLALAHVVGHPVTVLTGDQRAHVGAGVAARAHGELGEPQRQRLDEGIGHGAHGDRHGQRHAALAGRAVRRGHQGVGGHVEVGVRQHQGVVLGASQGLDALALRRTGLVDVAGDRGGAHEADGGDVGVVQQRVDGLLLAVDHVEDTVGQACLLPQPGQEHRRGRVLLAGLEDEGVPAGDGVRAHPQRDHRREVEGGDPGHHAQRLAQAVDVHAGGGAVGVAALEQLRDTGGVLDVLQPPHHLARGVGQGLALLGGHDRGELVEVPVQQLTEGEHHRGALGQRGPAPLGCGADGGGHHLADLLGAREVDLRGLRAGGGVEDRGGAAGASGHGASVDPVTDGGGHGQPHYVPHVCVTICV